MADTDYPALKWDPATGECRRFDAAHEVPDGWLDRPADPNAPPPAPPAPKPDTQAMARTELKAALDAGGISYAKNASDKALYELLHQKLYEALTARGESVAPGEHATALLERVNAAE